jgi:hypothetical protein
MIWLDRWLVILVVDGSGGCDGVHRQTVLRQPRCKNGQSNLYGVSKKITRKACSARTITPINKVPIADMIRLRFRHQFAFW